MVRARVINQIDTVMPTTTEMPIQRPGNRHPGRRSGARVCPGAQRRHVDGQLGGYQHDAFPVDVGRG
jgi:hypothetical protein